MRSQKFASLPSLMIASVLALMFALSATAMLIGGCVPRDRHQEHAGWAGKVRFAPAHRSDTRLWIGRKRLLKLFEKLSLTLRFTLEIQHVGLTTLETGSYSK
jgi:hypothetical protein